ncbi:uncharacterized protein LOC133178523 isoform X2 [Saccostrea echinata]|uniref:uncharacterized protein LOC133178523 isoform X2 n=1 Tax=Saccostrea echinata TaxID=191078 RepID=UPI002A838032|nr:uncharacterized protein LOC133178523 isoform X2 [Saccostrea echinata]
MDTNGTEDPQASLPTNGVGHIIITNIKEQKVFIMEDPVFMAITGVILFIGILFLGREIISRIKNRQYRHHRQTRRGDHESEPAVSPSPTPFSDDPPPYPGKYSKTNINYLPSYDSAIKMAPELRMCSINEMTPQSEFSVLDESVGLDHSDHMNNEETENDSVSNQVCHELLTNRECEPRTDDQQVFSEETERSPRQTSICVDGITLNPRRSSDEENI